MCSKQRDSGEKDCDRPYRLLNTVNVCKYPEGHLIKNSNIRKDFRIFALRFCRGGL